jgi:hypothetical protein
MIEQIQLLRIVRDKMHELHIEHRERGASLARDLARQLSSKNMHYKAAIVSNNPVVLLAATKRQWMKLIRRTERERFSTLNAVRIAGLTKQIAWMQSMQFSAKPPEDLLEADVTFAAAEDFVRTPPVCQLIYVTYEFSNEKLYLLTSWMPKGGTVVIYE